MSLPQLPAATYSSDNYVQLEHVALQTSPITTIARTYDSSVVNTAESKTLNTETKLIEIAAGAYTLFFRFLSTDDTTAVTTANFDQYIKPNQSKLLGIPEGKTSISYISPDGTSSLILLEF